MEPKTPKPALVTKDEHFFAGRPAPRSSFSSSVPVPDYARVVHAAGTSRRRAPRMARGIHGVACKEARLPRFASCAEADVTCPECRRIRGWRPLPAPCPPAPLDRRRRLRFDVHFTIDVVLDEDRGADPEDVALDVEDAIAELVDEAQKEERLVEGLRIVDSVTYQANFVELVDDETGESS
jgi:predicted  nucleic acid-binding Zn-ribbon protein